MLKRILRAPLDWIEGKTWSQRLFERLLRISLRGLNIGRNVVIERSGESNAINYIKKKLQSISNPVIFDVGANVGNYSVLLNKYFSGQIEIHAFEPSKETFLALLQKIDGLENVSAFHFGFGDSSNKMSLYSALGRSGLSSVYNRRLNHFNIELDKVEEIEIRTIDEYMIESGVNQINFLKIDVEGHDFAVLEGAKKTLANGKIDFIQFEFGGTHIDSRTFFQDFFYILKEKYRIYRILRNGLHEISQYSEHYEIFLTTNYLAERK